MKKLLFLLLLIIPLHLHADVTTEGGYVVEASFISTAPIQVVWSVLTDYNNIPSFVPNVIESKFTAPDRLQQKVRGHFWFFRKTIDLDLKIKETLYNKIEFETVSSSESFKVYNGSWQIREGNVVYITYTLVAEPNFFIPKGLINGVLKRETSNYIKSIQKEINRRKENYHG